MANLAACDGHFLLPTLEESVPVLICVHIPQQVCTQLPMECMFSSISFDVLLPQGYVDFAVKLHDDAGTCTNTGVLVVH